MTIPEPLKNFWKKIQGHVYFEAIKWIALLAVSAMTPYVLRTIQRIHQIPQLDLLSSSLLAVLTFCALLLTVIFFRGSHAVNSNSRPELLLSLGNLIWQYRTTDDLTVFFILASLVNRGDPSVAMNWQVLYRVGTSKETAELYNILGSYALVVNNTRITFTNDNLLNLKTLETPIQKGQFIGGRLFFAVPGDRSEQIKSIQHTIEIECQDYLGNASKARYQPSPTPPKALLAHYKEKREQISEKKEAGEPNAVKQPASVAITQEPPSLGDGS
jgi:hypothetical protein